MEVIKVVDNQEALIEVGLHGTSVHLDSDKYYLTSEEEWDLFCALNKKYSIGVCGVDEP